MNCKLNHVQNWPELARQAKWSAAVLAKQCRISKDSLRRHFLKYMGKSPGVWLAEQRQYLAIRLLLDGSSIKETATLLGYKYQTNFTRKYKEFWGTCPTLPMRHNRVAAQKYAKMINIASK
jgi:transcriptional regulator GlxA family with amidase domain